MIGRVDSSGRALLDVQLRHPEGEAVENIVVWIDTGFTGELVIPQSQVSAMKLPLGPRVTARLADGSEVQLDTFTCHLEWFGELKRIEVVANKGHFALLGIGLLLDRELKVDFRSMRVSLD